jgi:hypothetical protein
MNVCHFGFRIVGPTCERRRLVDAQKAFAGYAAWEGPASTTSFTDRAIAPGVSYNYGIFAIDAAGDASAYRSAWTQATPLHWADGGAASAFRGHPTGISCPSTSSCTAVDATGHALRAEGTSWGSPQAVAPTNSTSSQAGFVSVSCPTTTYCLGTLGGARLAEWKSGTWRVIAVDRDYGQVSCWAAAACAMTTGADMTEASGVARWVDGAVRRFVSLPTMGGYALSCPTSTCRLLTLSGSPAGLRVHTLGDGWTRTTRLSSGTVGSLDCAGATTCIAVSGTDYWRMTSSGWSTARRMTSDGSGVLAVDVACPTTTSCVAIGYTSGRTYAMHWDGSRWSTRAVPGTMGNNKALDCASSSSCVAIDDRGRYTRWNGSTWTTAKVFDNTRGGVNGLECSTATACVATDAVGNALSWSGGTTWPLTFLAEGPLALDCVGSWCMAIDTWTSRYRTRSAGSWSAASSVATIVGTSVQCASSARCFSPDHASVSTWNGTSWAVSSLPVDLGDAWWIKGDCPTASFCLLVGGNGRTAAWNGSKWASRGALPGDPGGPDDVDCTSATFCMVTTEGRALVLGASGWKDVGWTYGPNSVSCLSPTLCLGLHYGSLAAWDGSEWTDASQFFGWMPEKGMIRCVPGRCVAINGDRVWYGS